MSTLTKDFQFEHFSIFSNSDLDPRGPKRNPMKGIYKLFLYTKLSQDMSSLTKVIQFQPFFYF